MSGLDLKRYEPVSVEDWDDEAQSSVPGTRTTANVAVKRDLFSDSENFPRTLVRYHNDGTDSGYASKAPTVSSMASSSRRLKSDLKVDTIQIERERKPYAMTAAPRDAKEKDSREEPKPVKKPFCHKEGICWVCDRFGFHFDPKDPPKDLQQIVQSKSKTTAPQTTLQPPKTAAPKAKAEEMSRPQPRRTSTSQTRPTSMYVTAPVQAAYHQHPAMHTGWTAAAPLQGVAYSSYPYMTPATPVAYMPQQPQHFYFEPQPVFEDYPPTQPRPSRRTSMVSQERPALEKRPSRTSTMLERSVSREQRPQIVSHKSSKSIDVDKVAMPPPPKPQHATTINAARPRPGRANTYHANNSSHRRSRYEESEDESEEEFDPRALMSHKPTPPSPRRPPSSYKPPTHPDDPERPQLTQKSKSYHDGSNAVHVASTARANPMVRRRTTESMPSASVEQKEEAAEAYMRKRGSIPVNNLTAENLKELSSIPTRQPSDQRSVSGSTNSHITHQSSSKDSSSGRGRNRSNSAALGHSKGTSMNININGLNLNITDGGVTHGEGPPVRLDVGGVQISMNNRDKENIDHYKRPQKQLERAPSMSSRPSRRSLTQNNLVSTAIDGQRRERDEMLAIEAARDPRDPSRRYSYVDEDERDHLREVSARSSRQPSRNASSARQPAEDLPVRPKVQSHRSSVDYTRRDEPIMM